jgi:enoyl-CoA hydratase
MKTRKKTRAKTRESVNSNGRKRIRKQYKTLLYDVEDGIATVTLNRPDRLNTIVPPMPDEIEDAIGCAVADREAKVIVLRGAGRAFSAGFDFSGGFHHWEDLINTDGKWDPGKDFIGAAAAFGIGAVPKFMSIWRSPKPVIAQVHGWCVGGASDLALCADLVIATTDARIGTPYSRIWGCALTGMWIYRLGLAKAKEFALTGKPLTGVEAAAAGLINRAVPFRRLEPEVRRAASELASIPLSQLSAMKLIVNQAYDNMGLASTQTLGPILDGLMRNTPDALRFIERANREGVPAAVASRDGRFRDYSQGRRNERPNPRNVIRPQ